MKEIKLSRGMAAFVDDEDYEDLSKSKWYSHRTKNRRTGQIRWYAARTIHIGKKKVCQLMHRVIMKCPDNMEVHHMPDPDTGIEETLYNCKHRLKIVTRQEHCALRGIQRNNTTGYKGVRRRGNSYQARTKINGKEVCFSSGSDPIEMAKVYDKAMVTLYGEHAILNFPNLIQEYKS